MTLVYFCVLFSLAMLDVHVTHGVNNNKGVPTLFIFGDSTFDVGTNNFLNRSLAQANFPYNGIDFYHSIPTGRFSNGFNTADQIARQFGYKKSPPPFLALEKNQHSFKKRILQGTNFASGGAGILRDTGSSIWKEVIFMERQVDQFAAVRGYISEIFGPAKADKFVCKALFLISVGSNDFFDYARNDSGSYHMGPEEYLTLVQFTYYTQIKRLYDLGARKFGILSIAPIGCCPAVSSKNGGNCSKPLNDFAVAFHSATLGLLQNLSSSFVGFRYSLGDSFAMTWDLLNNPSTYGFNETKSACCGIGFLNGEDGCIKAKNASLCSDRKKFLFWDWFHPTQKASHLAAKTVFGGGNQYVTPINFSQLAEL